MTTPPPGFGSGVFVPQSLPPMGKVDCRKAARRKRPSPNATPRASATIKARSQRKGTSSVCFADSFRPRAWLRTPKGEAFWPHSTGGMGTTILHVAGSILVLAAAILLITKRRMNAED